MSKDSVKKRLGSDSKVGMSFTEFTYQLLQGYDFLYLYETMVSQNSNELGAINGAISPQELGRLVRRGGARFMRSTCPLITPKPMELGFGKKTESEIFGLIANEHLLISSTAVLVQYF